MSKISEKEWEEITSFINEKAKEANWEDPYWISFKNAHNENLCPDYECPDEVSEMLEKHFEITTGIDIESAWFNYENCEKVAKLICEHFAEKWYKYHVEQKEEWAMDFEEYKSNLESQLIDGSGSQDSDLFVYDELSGNMLDSWPVHEASCIDELKVLLENPILISVDQWEGISRIINGFSRNKKIRDLVGQIYNKVKC